MVVVDWLAGLAEDLVDGFRQGSAGLQEERVCSRRRRSLLESSFVADED